MEWTTETPTRDGYYWQADNKYWSPRIVEVCGERVYYIATDHSDDLSLHINGLRWMGPLEAPREATVASPNL